MNISTGTLRRSYRQHMFNPAGSFEAWVKLNVKLILKHYDDRSGFTPKARQLLES